MSSSLMHGGPRRLTTLGDGLTVSGKMTGTVFLNTGVKTKTPKRIALNDTIHAPSLDNKLVSCSALNRDGYDVSFSNGKCYISRPGDVICTGELRGGLYVLSNVTIAGSDRLASENPVGERLWHYCFGHTNVETLKQMARKETVRGLDFNAKPEQGASCVPCTLGKQSRLSSKGRSKKPLAPGEIFYSDVCGALPVQSIGGNKYFVTFTDAMSSYKTVRVMQTNADVLGEFLSVHIQFEHKYGYKIKLLYSDNGDEYLTLQDNLYGQGIGWDYSAPYSLQQNGVAERLNRTPLETARTILQHSGIPDWFWGEAVTTAAELQNMVGTRSLDRKTPSKLLTSNRPFVGILRTFGCGAWTLVSKRKKLDPKARRGIVLRSLPRGVYRVWYIRKQRIVHVRHVRVNVLQNNGTSMVLRKFVKLWSNGAILKHHIYMMICLL